MTISEKIAGIPNKVNIPTVYMLIGIIKLSGEAIKLYPYNTNALITILFIKLNIFFTIISPLNIMNLFYI